MTGGKKESRDLMDFLIKKSTVKIHEKDGSCFYVLLNDVFQIA